jgi:hypothetical protein
MMPFSTYKLLAGMVIGYAALFLLQLWTELLSWPVFTKLSITFAVIFVAVGAVIVLKRDIGEEERLKKNNSIR